MADLDEGPLQFPPGIYQLENGDPIDGGVPNLASKTGMDNVPHLMLAQRTAWLKAEVAKLAEALEAQSILEALKPVDGANSGLDADLLDGKHASAFVLTSDLQAKVKMVDGTGSGIDADLLDGRQGSEYALYSDTLKSFPRVAAENGYQIMPAGLILQWGRANGVDDGDAIVFPTSFSSACYAILITDANNGGGPGAADVIGYVGNPGKSGFTVRIFNIDGTAQVGREFSYMAIGK